MKRLLLSLIIVFTAALAAGCAGASTNQSTLEPTQAASSTPTAGSDPATPVDRGEALMDYAAFIGALEDAGWPVEEVGPTSGSLFNGAGHIIKVNGIEMQVFEYADEQALEAQAALISPDGGQITDSSGAIAIVDWVDMPHFFKKGRIMVVYIGRTERTLLALKDVLGERFAGGTVEAWGEGSPTPIPPLDEMTAPPGAG